MAIISKTQPLPGASTLRFLYNVDSILRLEFFFYFSVIVLRIKIKLIYKLVAEISDVSNENKCEYEIQSSTKISCRSECVF